MARKNTNHCSDSVSMIDSQTVPPQTVVIETPPLSMAEYASQLANNNNRILPGASKTFWAGYESAGMIRLPLFHTAPPTSDEVDRVLWKSRAAVASYLIEPDRSHPANAWLYVCVDQAYALNKLPYDMRKNVRRGLKEFKIEVISVDQFLRHGARSFCDSRRRNGLTDGTEEEFHRRFDVRANSPGHIILGAWRDGFLAAFLFSTLVDGWAENEGPFGADRVLNLRPNHALLFWYLSHYLSQGTCRLVSIGLSSIQADTSEKGLHEFKIKAGFEARPVHRAFVLNPLLRPLANHLTLRVLQTLLHFRPGDRRLRKAGGILNSILGKAPPLNIAEEGMG